MLLLGCPGFFELTWKAFLKPQAEPDAPVPTLVMAPCGR